MVGVFVTFAYGDDFDPKKVAAIADGARERFVGMPHLRSKTFTIDPAARTATNFYVWDSREAAEAFFTDELREFVTGLYGVAPEIRYAEIATLVQNA
jgi:hypothetical protein